MRIHEALGESKFNRRHKTQFSSLFALSFPFAYKTQEKQTANLTQQGRRIKMNMLAKRGGTRSDSAEL
jgi:hypothetical protein